jgi:hypothetical protein
MVHIVNINIYFICDWKRRATTEKEIKSLRGPPKGKKYA